MEHTFHNPFIVEDASQHLHEQNFTWRLSRDVLHYTLPTSTSRTVLEPSQDSELSKVEIVPRVRVYDNALPDEMIQHLNHVFRIQSPFWSEHHYDAWSNASRKANPTHLLVLQSS